MVGPCGCWGHAATRSAKHHERTPHQFRATGAGPKQRTQHALACALDWKAMLTLLPCPVPRPCRSSTPDRTNYIADNRTRQAWNINIETLNARRSSMRSSVAIRPTDCLALLSETHQSRAAHPKPKILQRKLFPLRFQSLAATGVRSTLRLARRSHSSSPSRCSHFKPTQHHYTFLEN